MECSLVIKGIAGTKILRDLQDAFQNLTGMEFSFIDLKGEPLIISQYAGHSRKVLLSAMKKDAAFLDFVAKSCNSILGSKKPLISEYNKLSLAFIPVMIEGNVIGAAMICSGTFRGGGQTVNLRISREQLKNASDLLFVFINYVFKHEFDFLLVSDTNKQYSRNQEAVLKAVAFMKKNYHDKDISLRKVAAEVSLSHYYFSHIFKDELKITFIEYLTKVRIEVSMKLLKNRNLSVNQIAYAVGYQDPNYFSKVFKRHMKTSPIEYRNNILKKGMGKQIITA